MTFRNWIREIAHEGPQGWVGTWLCITLAIFAVLCAGFDIARWFEFVSSNWGIFPTLFAVSLSGQLWNKKNKMQYVPEYYIEDAKKNEPKA